MALPCLDRHPETHRIGIVRTMCRRFGPLVVAIALMVGCSSREQLPVVWVDDEDPSLQAATAQARKTVGEFIARLQKPAVPETYFSVKARIQEGDVVEHVWLSDVRLDGAKFVGTLDNDPERLANMKAGQTHAVASDQISDWMILENNKLIGGYTIRALRDQVPPEQRATWNRELGFTIDEPAAEPVGSEGLRSNLFAPVMGEPEDKGTAP